MLADKCGLSEGTRLYGRVNQCCAMTAYCCARLSRHCHGLIEADRYASVNRLIEDLAFGIETLRNILQSRHRICVPPFCRMIPTVASALRRRAPPRLSQRGVRTPPNPLTGCTKRHELGRMRNMVPLRFHPWGIQ